MNVRADLVVVLAREQLCDAPQTRLWLNQLARSPQLRIPSKGKFHISKIDTSVYSESNLLRYSLRKLAFSTQHSATDLRNQPVNLLLKDVHI